MAEHKTCTVRFSDGHYCGKPGIYSFESKIEPGRIFVECEAHFAGHVDAAKAAGTPRFGDVVPVHRHGKVYTGRVVRVGPRSGKVFAEVTYDNGATRVVEVD